MKEIDFVKKLEKTYKGEKFYTKREIGVGYGIADLVLFRPHISNCLKRIDLNNSNHYLMRVILKFLIFYLI
ncbi:MAG: hypothetical protein ACOX1Z_01815 [Candidatus Ratteibacteria bacterium]